MDWVSASRQPDSCPICANPTTSLSLAGLAAGSAGAGAASAEAGVSAGAGAAAGSLPHPANIMDAMHTARTIARILFFIFLFSFSQIRVFLPFGVFILPPARWKVFTIKKPKYAIF